MNATPHPLAEDMGVTGNAILLLGVIAGLMGRDADQAIYEVVEAYPAEGWQILRHMASENTYRVSVVQLDGTV